MSSRSGRRKLPERPEVTEAAIWAWLHRAAVEDVPPEPLDGPMAAALATVLLQVLTENVRHQLGVDAGQARAAAIGWIAAKAQKEVN